MQEYRRKLVPLFGDRSSIAAKCYATSDEDEEDESLSGLDQRARNFFGPGLDITAIEQGVVTGDSTHSDSMLTLLSFLLPRFSSLKAIARVPMRQVGTALCVSAASPPPITPDLPPSPPSSPPTPPRLPPAPPDTIYHTVIVSGVDGSSGVTIVQGSNDGSVGSGPTVITGGGGGAIGTASVHLRSRAH